VRRLNARVDPVILRALESSPSRRYRTCAEFAGALRDFLASQGGVAGREDLKKFVSELFPNEVQLNQLGPVPFEEYFSLDDIAGVPTLERAPDEAEERRSFSGGAVDERTPTSDGLPVFLLDDPPGATAEVKTVPEGSAAAAPADAPRITWDAPAAELPAGPSATVPANGEALNKRVRVVEDFAPGPTPAAPREPRRARREVQKAAKTIMTFVVPFKREGDPEIPDLEKLRLRSRRQARIVAFIATVILFSVVSGLVVGWYQSTTDPKATLLSYLPDPIEREVALNKKPPPPLGKPLELPDFDRQHPDKAFGPKALDDRPPDRPPESKVVKPKAPSVPAGCYQAPKGSTGFLTVSAGRSVRVEIDGQKVCGPASKLPVEPGNRTVRIIDTRTKQEYVSTTRIQSGKLVKLVPTFQ
jgi:hypothetical protein